MFLCFTAWFINLGAAVFNMCVTSKWFGSICFFDQHYQAGKISLQVLVLMIKYLVAASFELCIV